MQLVNLISSYNASRGACYRAVGAYMDVKKLLKIVHQVKKTDRRRFSIYVSEKIYKDFTTACGGTQSGVRSPVLESLMEEFIKEVKNS